MPFEIFGQVIAGTVLGLMDQPELTASNARRRVQQQLLRLRDTANRVKVSANVAEILVGFGDLATDHGYLVLHAMAQNPYEQADLRG